MKRFRLWFLKRKVYLCNRLLRPGLKKDEKRGEKKGEKKDGGKPWKQLLYDLSTVASASWKLRRPQASPGSQMADSRPLAHLDAHLCNYGGPYHPINAGNVIEQFHLARVGFELGLEFRVHLLEVAIKSAEPVELD